MSKISTIWEESKEAKLYLSGRHDRDDEPVLTFLLEDLDTKAAVSYTRWRPAGDPKDTPLWAPV